MHIWSINFISFTAKIYNALHMQGKKGDFGILGASWPPKSAYAYISCQRRCELTKRRADLQFFH